METTIMYVLKSVSRGGGMYYTREVDVRKNLTVCPTARVSKNQTAQTATDRALDIACSAREDDRAVALFFQEGLLGTDKAPFQELFKRPKMAIGVVQVDPRHLGPLLGGALDSLAPSLALSVFASVDSGVATSGGLVCAVGPHQTVGAFPPPPGGPTPSRDDVLLNAVRSLSALVLGIMKNQPESVRAQEDIKDSMTNVLRSLDEIQALVSADPRRRPDDDEDDDDDDDDDDDFFPAGEDDGPSPGDDSPTIGFKWPFGGKGD